MGLQYKELLQLARQKLTPSEDANSSEPMDKNLMLRDGLMSKKSKDEEEQPSVDNMSNIYKKVINYNNELKNEVASYEDTLPVGEAAGMVLVDDKPKVDFKVSEVGMNLMGDLEETLGLTKEQAAGFVGNLDHETLGFKFMQEIKPTVKGSKGGYGFAQWTGSRRKAFEDWAQKNNAPINSYEANFGYLIHEIRNTSEGRFMKNLEETTTAKEAARVVSELYLRPGKPDLKSRFDKAEKYNKGSQ